MYDLYHVSNHRYSIRTGGKLLITGLDYARYPYVRDVELPVLIAERLSARQLILWGRLILTSLHVVGY